MSNEENTDNNDKKKNNNKTKNNIDANDSDSLAPKIPPEPFNPRDYRKPSIEDSKPPPKRRKISSASYNNDKKHKRRNEKRDGKRDGKREEKRDGKREEKREEKRDEKREEKRDEKQEEKRGDELDKKREVSLVFFLPNPHNILGRPSLFEQCKPNESNGPNDDNYKKTLDNRSSCGKSDCNHRYYMVDEDSDAEEEELRSITKINNINDLIKLGQLYHCKKRIIYMGVELKTLYRLVVPLQRLNRLIGLKTIKENIVNQIVYFLSGLQSDNDDMMHTIIEGPPGCGKTEVGRILGEIYMNMGILQNKIFRIVKRSELIGKYLGHTAVKTQEVIDSCNGGVMFIDEAYSLGDNEGRDSFSKECLDTLNQNLSDNKHKFLCIIAGYMDALDKNFFAFNDGLRRRFSFKYVIDKYTADELRDIFLQKVSDFGWKITNGVNISEFFKKHYELFPNFGGDMETLFLNIRICHGRRIFCLDKEIHRKLLNNEDFEQGLKSFAEHRKNSKEDAVTMKMKEYSMYI